MGGQNAAYFNVTAVCRYIYSPLCFKGLNTVSCINQLVSRGAGHSEHTRPANGIELGLMALTYWGSTEMKVGFTYYKPSDPANDAGPHSVQQQHHPSDRG